MQIMLCGSADIEMFCEQFKIEILKIEGIPLCFTDGSLYHNSYLKWDKNSKITVEESDLVVFLINQKYGTITWEIEYQRATEIGKPFIILCLDNTYTNYLNNFNSDLKTNLSKSQKTLNDLFVKLEQENRTIVTFPVDGFSSYLRKQIAIVFKIASNSLQKENKRLSLIELVKTRDDKNIKKLSIPENKVYLKDLLRDVFQPKEVRKRVLECFTFSDELRLTTQEIVDLFYDPEQGVTRRTIQLLPTLVYRESNIDEIFETLILLADDSDDVGIDRRSVISMLDTNLDLAVKYLQKMPMKDVGTPRRIIQWIETNESVIIEKLKTISFKKDYLDLIEVCLTFNQKKEEWKEIAKKVKDWAVSSEN